MTTQHEKWNEHERFKELGALANSGTLTASEWSELKGHLRTCEECRETYSQYLILAKEGIPMLASRYTHREERGSWDDTSTRRKLFDRVWAAEGQTSLDPAGKSPIALQPHALWAIWTTPLARAAFAACLVVAVGLGAYRLGSRAQDGTKLAAASAEDRFQKLAAEKKSVAELLDAQTKRLLQLQEDGSGKEQQLAKLRSALRTLKDRSNQLTVAKTTTQEQLRTVAHQRDALSGQLRDTEHAYQKVQAELVSLRIERDKALLRTTSLESRIEELSAANRDQERRLSNQEQYLSSDRDIRELMGARKLYIADVFDVDSSSRTRKPFGRVFYTQGKSLIFYAFDLDRQPGLKVVSAFQVWGRKETAQGDQARPLNLGILYMDSEANRRWVLRCDDPKQLAEIDAVFVTVEPHGGSQKPTAKPFLYALLRKEANHP